MKVCFGIDIGGTTVKLGLFSGKGEMLERWEIPTRRGSTPDGLLLDVKAALEGCLARRGLSRAEVLGVGITAPGPVTQDGILHGTVNIGWGDVALGREAEKILGLGRACIGNDARVAALGEAVFGAGKGTESMLMVTLGTGVGGGVVRGGEILTGYHGVAGEIGHMTVDPYETLACSCGKKGCLEQYASATGMVRVAEKLLAERDAPSLLREGKVTAKALWDCAKAGDPVAGEVADFVCHRLGLALANAAYLVDPEMFVIGGGVSAAGQFLLGKVERAYRANVFPHSRDKKFALAELGNDAGIQGAAALLLNAVGSGTPAE